MPGLNDLKVGVGFETHGEQNIDGAKKSIAELVEETKKYASSLSQAAQVAETSFKKQTKYINDFLQMQKRSREAQQSMLKDMYSASFGKIDAKAKLFENSEAIQQSLMKEQLDAALKGVERKRKYTEEAAKAEAKAARESAQAVADAEKQKQLAIEETARKRLEAEEAARIQPYNNMANMYAQNYANIAKQFASNDYASLATQANNAADAIGRVVSLERIASAQQVLADPSSSYLEKAEAARTLATEYSNLKPKAMQAADAIRKVGDEAQKSSAKASSSAKGGFANLWSSLMRIAKLRFLRGIIRGITSSFREGITNIYQYSQAMNSTDASNFSNSMNELASSLNYMKNAIGAAVAPLIAQLVPAISTVANWFVIAANAVAQFFAAFGGQTTYTRAKKQAAVWKDVSAGASGAAAAAQEYKNTILGFDEINALNDTSGGGGGGGGGGSSPDYSDMFEEVPLDTEGIIGAFNRLAQKLQPITQAIGEFIKHDIVENGLNMIDGGLTAVMGIFEQDKEQFERGMKQIQDVISNTEWVKNLAKGVNSVMKFFNKIPLALSQMLNDVVGWIVDKLSLLPSGILEKFGINIDEWKASIKKTNDEIARGEQNVDKYFDAWDQWYEGKISTEELYKIQHDLREGIDSTRKTIIDTAAAYVTMGAKGVASSSSVRGSMGLLNSSCNTVKNTVQGIKDKIVEVSKTNISNSGAVTGVNNLGNSARNTATQVGNVQANVNSLNNTSASFYGISSGISNMASNVANASNWIETLRAKIILLNGIKVAYSLQSAVISAVNALHFANGGFVPGFANGGIIPAFASGGINSANLFMAHENAAPELVGRIGNHTAVANTSQMVDAMAAGVYRAMSEILSTETGVNEVNVYIDGTKIAGAVDRANKLRNRRFNVQC